ncbi:MAG: KilA-N domain-containing protein [Gammaproteobacteria bacterium]|nr:KilA-N domain-containing protein [Gammaproteobacteria bacterium]
MTTVTHRDDDLGSLTDIARFKNPDRSYNLVRNWLHNRNALEFLGIWEQLQIPDSNPVEFDGVEPQSVGTHS